MTTISTRLKWVARALVPGAMLAGARRVKVVDEAPPGWHTEALRERAELLLGEPLQRVRYQQLSRWKHGGAVRLELTGRDGSSRRVVLKDSSGADEAAGVLRPQVDGVELMLHTTCGQTLAPFVAELVATWDMPDDCLLVFEDLGRSHRPAVVDQDLTDTAGRVPRLHDALRGVPDDQAQRLGDAVPPGEELADEIRRHLTDAPLTPDGWANRLLDVWEPVAELLVGLDDRLRGGQVIHGDLNPSNVLVPRRRRRDTRFVDWEWLTVGVPEQDLASLLKAASPRAAARAIGAYRSTGAPFSEQRYAGAMMQRALADAGFLAALATSGDRPSWVDAAVEGACRTALQTAAASFDLSIPK